MNLGIFAKTFKRESVKEVFAAVRLAGYSATQFNMACVGLSSLPERIEDDTLEVIRTEAAAHEVALVALSGTFNMAHPVSETRAAGVANLRVLARACSNLQIPVLTLCTGSRDPVDMWRRHPENTSKEAKADFLHTLEAAIRIAESEGLLLAIEPEPGNIIDSAIAASQLIRGIGSSRIRVILDPANLVRTQSVSENRTAIEAACQLLGDYIVIAHAKDRDADGTIRPAGEGVVDFPHFLKCLQEVNFRGPLIVHGIEETQATQVARYLKTISSSLGEEIDRAAV